MFVYDGAQNTQRSLTRVTTSVVYMCFFAESTLPGKHRRDVIFHAFWKVSPFDKTNTERRLAGFFEKTTKHPCVNSLLLENGFEDKTFYSYLNNNCTV